MTLHVETVRVIHAGEWKEVRRYRPGASQRVVHGGVWKTPRKKMVVRWVLNAGGDPENPADYTKTWVTEFNQVAPTIAPSGSAMAGGGSGSGPFDVRVNVPLPPQPDWFIGAVFRDAATEGDLGGGNNESDRTVGTIHLGDVTPGTSVYAVCRYYTIGGGDGPTETTAGMAYGDAV